MCQINPGSMVAIIWVQILCCKSYDIISYICCNCAAVLFHLKFCMHVARIRSKVKCSHTNCVLFTNVAVNYKSPYQVFTWWHSFTNRIYVYHEDSENKPFYCKLPVAYVSQNYENRLTSVKAMGNAKAKWWTLFGTQSILWDISH